MKDKTCKNCKHYLAEMFHCQKNDVMAEAHNTCEDFEPKIITNGDKIRQMSNKNLAIFLGDTVYCFTCPTKGIPCFDKPKDVCYQKWLDYLNAPSESEVNNG